MKSACWGRKKDGGTLTFLKEGNAGALYLNRVETPFKLRDDTNRELA